MKTLPIMLKNDLTHQTIVKMNPILLIKYHFQQDKKRTRKKEKLGGKIMKEFVGLRAKTYAYLMDDDSEKKK